MSFPRLSTQDLGVLRRVCSRGRATVDLIEALCSVETCAERAQTVQGYISRTNCDMASLASSLSTIFSRLRAMGGMVDGASRGRVLQAAGACVVKVLSMDIHEAKATQLHRGLRQAALLLALSEAVRDNGSGSGAQRAAAAALLAFCERHPPLWKELAKEIRSDAFLLKGFLANAAALEFISDYRTQETIFESLFRLWKVWKKQPGGPPDLPRNTRVEVKQGLSSMSIRDFDTEVRAMLTAINHGGAENKEDDEWDGSPPSSFALASVNQMTDWEGMGCEASIGEVEWLDVGHDSVSVQVYPPGKSNSNAGSAGVLLSVPANIVATTYRHIVSTRSLRVEVSFARCPAFKRVVQIPPKDHHTTGSCVLMMRLKGGARDFARLRKAIVRLVATPATAMSTPAKSSVVCSKTTLVSPTGKARGVSRQNADLTPIAPRKEKGNSSMTQGISLNARGSAASHQESARKRKTIGSSIVVSPRVSVTLRRRDSAEKAVKNTRSIAEGRADRVSTKNTATWVQENPAVRELDEEDSWMSPQRQLNVALSGAARKQADLPASPERGTNADHGVPAATESRPKTLAKTTRQPMTSIADSARNSDKILVRGAPTPSPAQKRLRPAAASNALTSMSPGSLSDGNDRSFQEENEFGRTSVGRKGLASSAQGRCKDEKNDDARSEKIEMDREEESQAALAFSLESEEEEEEEDEVHKAAIERPKGRVAPRSSKRTVTGARGAGGGTKPATPRTKLPSKQAMKSHERDDLKDLIVEETCPALGEELSEAEQIDTPGNPIRGSKSSGDSCHSELRDPSQKGEMASGEESENNDDGEDSYDYIDDDEEGRERNGDGAAEDEDSAILTQLFNQFVGAAQARDQRTKKRKADAAIEETRLECEAYLKRTAQTLNRYWRRHVDELLEQAREAEAGVAAARETVQALTLEHKRQWEASRERMLKHQTAIAELDAQLASSSAPKGLSELEQKWQADIDGLNLRLQKHREGAVARFSATLAGPDKKRGRKGAESRTSGFSPVAASDANCSDGRDRDGASFPSDAGGISCLLTQLTMRTKI